MNLRRQTLDHLYVAIQRLIDSQAHMQECLIGYSQGDLHAANTALGKSQFDLVESGNRVRQFMTDIMLSASERADV